AEIELNIMDRQCTGGRMSSKELVSSEVQKWAKGRNKKKCTIQWKFTRKDADRKLFKHYVS
ncbi:MAG TPA: IS630 family transposase, partial [Puia sp.]|nr:IS630 family transposase [Puia sp.]